MNLPYSLVMMHHESFMKNRRGAVSLQHTARWVFNEPVRSVDYMRLLYDQLHAWYFPWLIFALVTMAELLTLLPDPRLGMVIHIATIFVLFYHLLETKDT